MPELPEVETIRSGLEPLVSNRRILRVVLNRSGLRFPFPSGFAKKIRGSTIVGVSRRAKYLLFSLSNGHTLLSHLGMTGNFRVARPGENGAFAKHDHVIFELSGDEPVGSLLIYSDPRRFGFMDLFRELGDCAFLADLGPEPLSNRLNGAFLAASFSGRRAPVKTLLLDQRILAGLGNIYVCEALFLARIHPCVPGRDLAGTFEEGHTAPLDALASSIRRVLELALEAGGSTLKDFRNARGDQGYFQHHFKVYDREGETCVRQDCGTSIERLVQSGRSSFFCPSCQTL